MQLTLIALTLVCLVPVFQKTGSPVKQNRTIVEVWCGGDDDLTRRVCHAVDSEFETSSDFLFDEEKPGALIVTVAENVGWKQRGQRLRVFYIVEFTTANEKMLARKKGECWEGDFKTCASQVLMYAKSAARKLPTRN